MDLYLNQIASAILEDYILRVPFDSPEGALIKAYALKEEYEIEPDSKEAGKLILQLVGFLESLCQPQEKIAA